MVESAFALTVSVFLVFPHPTESLEEENTRSVHVRNQSEFFPPYHSSYICFKLEELIHDSLKAGLELFPEISVDHAI